MSAAIQRNTHALVSTKEHLPEVAWQVFKGFNKVHEVWDIYRKGRTYSNPDNFSSLFAGFLANHGLRRFSLFSLAAQMVLIAARSLECAQQHSNFFQSFTDLKDAVTFHYPAPVNVPWRKDAKPHFFSPSTRRWFEAQRQTLKYRTCEISSTSLKFLKEGFVLSMRYLDVKKAVTYSSSSKKDAATEFFVNNKKMIKALTDNKKELLSELKRNSAHINRIFFPFSDKDHLKGLISKIESVVGFVENISRVIDRVNRAVLGSVYQLLLENQLAQIVPPKFYRPPLPKLKDKFRFPPDDLVRLGSYSPENSSEPKKRKCHPVKKAVCTAGVEWIRFLSGNENYGKLSNNSKRFVLTDEGFRNGSWKKVGKWMVRNLLY